MSARRIVVDLPLRPEAFRRARSIVREHGAQLPPDVVNDAELLASEVVSNAVRHGAAPLRLTLTAGDSRLTVEVSDGGDARPAIAPGDPDPGGSGGRGLRIVRSLATEWGVAANRGTPGKTVWFRMSDSSRAEDQPGVDQREETTWT